MLGLRRPGRALRPAPGLARAVAAEIVVGRDMLARGNQIALFARADCVPAALERLLLCPGCIDDRPTNMADLIVLLQRGNLLRGVGCISLTASDSRPSRREVRDEEEAAYRHVARTGQRGKRVSFGFTRKYPIHDRRMTLGQHAPGAFGQCLVNPLR